MRHAGRAVPPLARRVLIALIAIAPPALCCRSQSPSPPPLPAGPRPNVLLISIDSLRADRLRCYGHSRDTSPHIDALAAAGVRFERTMAVAPWTLPSHVSLLTGLHPREHDVNKSTSTLSPELPLLPTAFKQAGYRTGGIVSGPFMGRVFGFARGFDYYDDEIARMDEKRSHLEFATSQRLADKAIEWLRRYATASRPDRTETRPFFLFLHLWDVHYDYKPPPPYDRMFDPDYRGRANGVFRPWRSIFEGAPPGADRDVEHVRALYDGEVRYTDEHLGRVLDALNEMGVADSTIVCVTADHGDEFYEHGQGGHQRTLFDEVLRVPWIIRGPGVGGPRVATTPVSNIDIMPTLMELAGIPPPSEQLSGRSWAATVRGETAEATARPCFGETHYHWTAPATHTEGRLVSVELDGWKLIRRLDEPRFERLYDLRVDPGEQRDVAAANHDRAASLRKLLDEHDAKGPRYRAGDMSDPKTRSRLEELGYLQGEGVPMTTSPSSGPATSQMDGDPGS